MIRGTKKPRKTIKTEIAYIYRHKLELLKQILEKKKEE